MNDDNKCSKCGKYSAARLSATPAKRKLLRNRNLKGTPKTLGSTVYSCAVSVQMVMAVDGSLRDHAKRHGRWRQLQMKKTKPQPIVPGARKIHAACRLNVREMALIRSYAVAYTNGDVSKWLRFAALNHTPNKKAR